MNNKILAVLAVVGLAIAVWFFNHNKSETPTIELAKPEISSEVTDIKAVQTNPETGEVEYTLIAKSLIQNSQTGQDELIDVTMDWQPPNGQMYHIIAKRATLNQTTGELKFQEGFELVRDAIDDKPKMVMQGGILLGNTNDKKIWSDEPLTIIQGDDKFTAEAMQADLALGEYEFSKIMIEYNAPERVNKPLF